MTYLKQIYPTFTCNMKSIVKQHESLTIPIEIKNKYGSVAGKFSVCINDKLKPILMVSMHGMICSQEVNANSYKSQVKFCVDATLDYLKNC